jgi:hypothetical protein
MHQTKHNSSSSQHQESLIKTLDILDQMTDHTINLRKSIVESLSSSFVYNPLSQKLKHQENLNNHNRS